MTCFVYVLQTIQKTICSKYNTGTKFAVYWYLGSPSALSAKIDPDNSLGITPKKITRLVRESVAALRENGILADTYRSNGKRWISLKRAESADFLPVKTIGAIDPAGVASTRSAP